MFVLKPLIACSQEQQLCVRAIRNQMSVRAVMYTDHEISVEEHFNWVRSLADDKRQIVFAVLDVCNVPVGVVSINHMDFFHEKADWAFYLDQRARGGLGAALEYFLIEYVFAHLKLEKLNCEVLEINEAVVKLHKKFCFVEEGFRRKNIKKHGKRIGVYLLGLTKEDWLENKSKIKDRYKSIIDKFLITIQPD